MKLKKTFTLVILLNLLFSLIVAGQEMSGKEKVNTWKGERVILLKNEPGSYWKNIGGDGSCFVREVIPTKKKPERFKSLPDSLYAGKIGTIIDVDTTNNLATLARVAILLDETGELIKAYCAFNCFGFFSEFETAKTLVGKSFWAKGYLILIKKEDIWKQEHYRDLEKIIVKNTKKITITGVEWGDSRMPVLLCLQTEDGQEGYLLPDGWSNFQYYIENRFSVTYNNISYTDFLDTVNPRERYPEWTTDIWKMIEDGEIAIGMSWDMVKMVCGWCKFKEAGAIYSSSGDWISYYQSGCGGKKFFIENGKVVKFKD